MWFSAWRTRRGKTLTLPMPRADGLSDVEFSRLAQYNSEVAHGVIHTPEYDAKMKTLQERFDAPYKEINERRQKELDERVARFRQREAELAARRNAEG